MDIPRENINAVHVKKNSLFRCIGKNSIEIIFSRFSRFSWERCSNLDFAKAGSNLVVSVSVERVSRRSFVSGQDMVEHSVDGI